VKMDIARSFLTLCLGLSAVVISSSARAYDEEPEVGYIVWNSEFEAKIRTEGNWSSGKVDLTPARVRYVGFSGQSHSFLTIVGKTPQSSSLVALVLACSNGNFLGYKSVYQTLASLNSFRHSSLLATGEAAQILAANTIRKFPFAGMNREAIAKNPCSKASLASLQSHRMDRFVQGATLGPYSIHYDARKGKLEIRWGR